MARQLKLATADTSRIGGSPVAVNLARSGSTLRGLFAALRWARANDPDFPGPVAKSGNELLYRAHDLQRWARNRPRAAAPEETQPPTSNKATRTRIES